MTGGNYQPREVIFPTCVTEQTCFAVFYQVRLIELNLIVPRHAFWPKFRKTVKQNENIKPQYSHYTEGRDQKPSFSNLEI